MSLGIHVVNKVETTILNTRKDKSSSRKRKLNVMPISNYTCCISFCINFHLFLSHSNTEIQHREMKDDGHTECETEREKEVGERV